MRAWWAARPHLTSSYNWVLVLLLEQVVPRVCVVGGKAAPHEFPQSGAGTFT